MVIALITTLAPTLADEPGGPPVPELSLDQALFYRGFEASSPLSTGYATWGGGAAALVSLVRSIRYLDDAAWAEFQRLLSLESIKTLGLVFAAWVAVTVVGAAGCRRQRRADGLGPVGAVGAGQEPSRRAVGLVADGIPRDPRRAAGTKPAKPSPAPLRAG